MHKRLLSAALVAFALSCLGEAAQAKVLVEIDKSAQQINVSVDGQHLYTWPVSTGRAGRDTPGGSYRAFRMERDHYSKEWDDAPMPYSIFFTTKGHAIHGSYETKKLGSPASAGCVRLHPDNAAKLFELVEKQGVLNTTVVVSGDLQVALGRRHPAARREAVAGQPLDIAEPRSRALPRSNNGEFYYGQPQYRQPQYQYAQPQYGQPHYQYGQPQYAQPSFRDPYGQQYQPRYRDPYAEPYYRQPRQSGSIYD
jgi:L,D-transpeptidase catalytic domain